MDIEHIAAAVNTLVDTMPSGMSITLSDPIVTQQNRSVHLRYEGEVIMAHFGLWESQTAEIEYVVMSDDNVVCESLGFETVDEVRQHVRRFIEIVKLPKGTYH